MMNAADAWPFGNQFFAWMRANDRPIRNSEYKNAWEGKPVQSRHLLGLLLYVFAAERTDEDSKEAERRRKARDCVNHFMESQGVPRPQELEPAQYLDQLCEPMESQTEAQASRDNVFFEGLEGLHRMFQTKRRAYRHIHGCQNNNEILEAAKWFFADAGNWGLKQPLPPEEAIVRTETRFKASVGDYASFLTACHQRHPWTTVIARGDNKLTGASVVLPLRESVYRQVRAGKLLSCDIEPDSLVSPSRYLLLEALTHRPESMGGEPKHRATASMRWCIFAQIAALSQFSFSRNDSRPLYLLSIEGTPDAQKSLLSYGFKPTGTRMAVSGEDLYERTFSTYPIGRDMLFVMPLTMLSRDIDGPPPF